LRYNFHWPESEKHLAAYLNHEFGFDEVRWATMRKTSYDTRASFRGAPVKTLLSPGTRLYRLVTLVTGNYFDSAWWMPEAVFSELRDDVNKSSHGGGRLLRNYVAEYMALPSGKTQLCVVEIELTTSVYAWLGESSALFKRPGGMPQVFLPNLTDRGSPRISSHARVRQTYWLKF
jgi:hypothetical protein